MPDLLSCTRPVGDGKRGEEREGREEGGKGKEENIKGMEGMCLGMWETGMREEKGDYILPLTCMHYLKNCYHCPVISKGVQVRG